MFKVFERKCTSEGVFTLLKFDKVNAKYVSRAISRHFFLNYVVHTSRLDENCMHKQYLDNDRAKYVINLVTLVLCKNKS